MATPAGMVQSEAMQQRGIHAQEGGARAFEQLDDLRIDAMCRKSSTAWKAAKMATDEKHGEIPRWR